MPMPTAAAYFDRMRAQEHHLRHTLPPPHLYLLPATAQQLARIVGLPETLRLVEYMGGLTLRIPHGDTAAGRALLVELAKYVGEEGAQRLSAEFAASQIYVPNCKAALVAARDAALLRDRATLAAENLSERDIVACLAVRYRISDRQVWKILKKPAPEDATGGVCQGSLL